MSSLPEANLVALTWTMTAGAVVLTAGRYYIRGRMLGSFHVDDFVHGLALLTLIAYIITYTIAFPLNYKVEFFIAGLSTDEPTPAELEQYYHLIIAVSATFWVINFLVKMSFLMLYRLIFNVSKKFMVGWYICFGFATIVFLANFISVFWACGTPQDLYNIPKCLAPFALSVSATVTTMWCVLNVLSDISIMVLPISMLRSLNMPTAQKIALGLLFMVAIIDVIFDILRTVYTVHGGAVALDTIWDILEPTIAVIISSLPTYRSLYKPAKKQSTSYRNLDYTSKGMSGPSKNSSSRGNYKMSNMGSTTDPYSNHESDA